MKKHFRPPHTVAIAFVCVLEPISILLAFHVSVGPTHTPHHNVSVVVQVCTRSVEDSPFGAVNDPSFKRPTDLVTRRVYADGSVYEGVQGVNGTREGSGRLVNRHGDVYDGSWKVHPLECMHTLTRIHGPC